ncbi:MAG: RES family NAD+ phosphorylase, partial [Rhodospirillales bacterium]
MNIPSDEVDWMPCYRIIPSRFPPIDLFERVADPDDLEAVFEIESLTNPRLRAEVGEIRLVDPDDRISGPGTSTIMAAFTHLNPQGSRFTDGTFGVFYAGHELQTAISETVYHRQKFMLATRQNRLELDMRVYLVDLSGTLHNLRGQRDEFPSVYDSDDYSAGMRLATRLRAEGSFGIVYDSVRNPGGECAAVFRPPVLSNCRQGQH